MHIRNRRTGTTEPEQKDQTAPRKCRYRRRRRSDTDVKMDPLDQVAQLETESEQGWETFQQKLAGFPHSFQMEDQEFLHINTLRDVKNHLEATLRAGFKTRFETAYAINFVAYALFRLGQKREALERLKEALAVEGEDKNIVSLANKAVILWHAGRAQEAEKIVTTLQDMKENDKDFNYGFVKARAEIATSYMRLGPRFTRKAVNIFNEIIPSGRDPEVWVWKYGQALAHRFALNLQHTPVFGGEDSKEKHLHVLRLFQDIIQNAGCSSLKAKAYAEMALLLGAPLDTETKNALLAESGLQPLEAVQQALMLDNNDASTLVKAGNLYRLARNFPKAQELLQKAIDLQPSSKAYHYLGLIYKSLASMSKKYRNGSNDSNRDDMDCKGRESGKFCSDSATDQLGDQNLSGKKASDGEPTLVAENSGSRYLLPEHARSTDDDFTKSLALRIKSFPIGSCGIELSRNDEYVEETLETLQKAVEFSERMNSRAMLDLAYMYRSLGEFDDALALYEEICDKKFSSGPMDLVTAYEQRGLILKIKSSRDKDPEKQQQLQAAAELMLNRALSTASRLYSRTPHVRERLGDTWHSFSTLLKSVDESNRCQRDKLREKANLFRLIRKYKESLSLLQEIVKLAPDEENDPEYLKLVVENHVDDQRYSEALTFIELLQCTKRGSQTMDLFKDKHFLQKVYVKAAKDALLQGSSACHFFYSAFSDTFRDDSLIGSSESESTDASESSSSSESESTDASKSETMAVPDLWDVMLLHEDDLLQKAKRLADVLHDECGLRVTRMDQDVTLGKIRYAEVLRIMRMSRLVVVVTGEAHHHSRELSLYIGHAAERPSTVTLKAAGNYVPKVLRTHKAWSCPAQILDDSAQEEDVSRKEKASVVCDLFSFLLGIPV